MPFNIFNASTASGIWSKILQVKVEFLKLNIPIHSLFRPRLGDGARISFWKDPWVGDSSLANLFPRLYALDMNRSDSVCEKWSSSGWSWNWRRVLRYDTELEEFHNLTDFIRSMSPSELNDCWFFKPDKNGIFSVKALRGLVEEKSLWVSEELYPWINWIPIKLNVFAWRLFLLRLPTRSNISKRGISLNSSICELCYAEEETETHLFGSCQYAKEVWNGISSWCKVNIHCSGILLDLLSLPERYHMQKTNSKLCLAIIICGLWFIWKSRNEKVFKHQLTPVGRVLDDIQASAFMWIKNRWKSSSLNWTSWCCDPFS